MTIAKGQPWGAPGRLPDGARVARSDAEASGGLERERYEGRPFSPFGLLGGDLARTAGAPGDPDRLGSGEAVRLPIDVGEVLLDGRLHLFVAHTVVRSRSWRRAVVAMNAQWLSPGRLGALNAAPRAHPDDGLLDILDADLEWADLPKVLRRARLGAHLPHPRIATHRGAAWQTELDRPLRVWIDGRPAGRARRLAFRVRPDAATIVI